MSVVAFKNLETSISICRSFWLTVSVVTAVGVGIAGMAVTPFKLLMDGLVSVHVFLYRYLRNYLK